MNRIKALIKYPLAAAAASSPTGADALVKMKRSPESVWAVVVGVDISFCSLLSDFRAPDLRIKNTGVTSLPLPTGGQRIYLTAHLITLKVCLMQTSFGRNR